MRRRLPIGITRGSTATVLLETAIAPELVRLPQPALHLLQAQ